MDIVERLRSRPNDSHMETERLLDEAADHIEALRDKIDGLREPMKPADISQEVWDEALAALPKPGDRFNEHGVTVSVARAIQRAVEREREAIASYIEGNGGVIPGTVGFAPLVSRNRQPCMSGDGRDRLNKFDRRDFDDATRNLAAAIRARGK